MSKATAQAWELEGEGDALHPVWGWRMKLSPGWSHINLNISVLLSDGIYCCNVIRFLSLQNV